METMKNVKDLLVLVLVSPVLLIVLGFLLFAEGIDVTMAVLFGERKGGVLYTNVFGDGVVDGSAMKGGLQDINEMFRKAYNKAFGKGG